MPELPEVEAIAQTLRPLVLNRAIRRCRVIHPIAVAPAPGRGSKESAAAIRRRVRGQKIHGVERRGKYLVLLLDRGCMVLHFRLSGHLIWFDSHKLSGHVDVSFEMHHGTLAYVDPRHLGRVQWVLSPHEVPGIRALGVDPLSRDFSPARLAELLRASRLPLKLFLLDQSKIAGIGNIYASEAMWRARISPKRRANRVTPVEASRLHKAIIDALTRGLECCLHPAPDFRDPDWWFQGIEEMARVYGRDGKHCHACKHPIQRITQGGRSTFWCKHCQR